MLDVVGHRQRGRTDIREQLDCGRRGSVFDLRLDVTLQFTQDTLHWRYHTKYSLYRKHHFQTLERNRNATPRLRLLRTLAVNSGTTKPSSGKGVPARSSEHGSLLNRSHENAPAEVHPAGAKVD